MTGITLTAPAFFSFLLSAFVQPILADWPPSSSIDSKHTVICLSDQSLPSYPLIPEGYLAGLTEEYNDEYSAFSEQLKAICDPTFAASDRGQQWDKCDSGSANCTGSTGDKRPFYTMTYNKQDEAKKFEICLSAAYAIVEQCLKKGKSHGEVYILNRMNNDPNDRYQLTVEPKLPFPGCDNKDPLSGGHDSASIGLIVANMCGDDVCTEHGAQFNCQRTIAQQEYAITGRRQNFGANDFKNCETAMRSIAERCYLKGKGGGWWQGVAPSQEWYQITIDQLHEYQADLQGGTLVLQPPTVSDHINHR